MCHSCVSRNPGLFPRKREPRKHGRFFLDSRLRGNDTLQAASLHSQPSPAVGGEAGCFIRLKCYKGNTLAEWRQYPRRMASRPPFGGPKACPSTPLTRRYLRPRRLLPPWGEASCFIRLKCYEKNRGRSLPPKPGFFFFPCLPHVRPMRWTASGPRGTGSIFWFICPVFGNGEEEFSAVRGS